ncbi:DUF2789 domain-containing protein [Stenotrophomonas sp. TWI587]|jgi:hypothetical protein|uniref:DUF2789 domain-containing protein n=1 Tax=unclassified Stenotrophomonas TaxID=196198 RepID=UPI00320AFB55
MITTEPRMTNLFLQLGLEASEEAIAAFIRDHQLSNEIRLIEAPYWNDGQRQFLTEQLRSDAEWAIVVDELSEALHADATEQANAS